MTQKGVNKRFILTLFLDHPSIRSYLSANDDDLRQMQTLVSDRVEDIL